jgi:hypothetical protein
LPNNDQTFSEVQPIQAAQPQGQSFTDVSPIASQSQAAVNQPRRTLAEMTYGANDPISKYLTSAADKIDAFMSKPEVQAPMNVIGPGAGERAASNSVAAISDMLPSAERAGQNFKELSSVIGQHTAGMTDALSDATQEVSKLAKSGGQMPKVVGDFINRIMDTDQGPLTFDEARRFQSMAGKKITALLDTNSQPIRDSQMLRSLANWRGEITNVVNDTADQAGQLAKHLDAMAEYRGAMKLAAAKAAAIKAAAGAAVTAGTGAVLGGGAQIAGVPIAQRLKQWLGVATP